MGILFIIGLGLAIKILMGVICLNIAVGKGHSGAWFFVGFLLGIIGIVIILCLSPKKETEYFMPPPMMVADEIKKLNELREMGALTDEEFNDKKKELLGL